MACNVKKTKQTEDARISAIVLTMRREATDYPASSIRWFLIRRLHLRSIFAASGSGLTVDRYFRLIALAVSDGIVLLFSRLCLWYHPRQSRRLHHTRSAGWDTIHAGFELIAQYPEEILTNSAHIVFVINFYNIPMYSLVFFTFFGLGEEAIEDYVNAARSVRAFLVRKGLLRPP